MSSHKKFHASGPGVSKANGPRDSERFGRSEKNTKRLGNEQLTQQRQQVTRLSTARQANKLIATLQDGALRKIDTKGLCSPGKTLCDPWQRSLKTVSWIDGCHCQAIKKRLKTARSPKYRIAVKEALCWKIQKSKAKSGSFLKYQSKGMLGTRIVTRRASAWLQLLPISTNKMK